MDTIPAEITRRIPFEHIDSSYGMLKWLMLVLSLLALAFLIRSLARKFSLWGKGDGKPRTDYPEKRLILLLKYAFLQKRIWQNKFSGVMHGLILCGFLGLVLICFVLMIEQNLTGPVFNNYFIRGSFYIRFSCIADIFGLMLLVGLILAICRRYVSKPVRFDTEPSDTLLLLLLSLLVLSGFFLEGMRIAAAEFPEFEKWAFAGWLLAKPFGGMSYDTLILLYRCLWWFHIFCGFCFVALLATGKTGHPLIASLNIYHADLRNFNAHTKYTINLEKASFEQKNTDLPLVLAGFSRKDLADLDVCISCGICQDNCPAWITEKHLSPMRLIKEMKKAFYGKESALKNENIKDCTDCAACSDLCPVFVEHLPKITALKRQTTAEGCEELKPIFGRLESTGFPFEGPWLDYEIWLSDMRALGVVTEAYGEGIDCLYFPGSLVATESASRDSALAFAGLLKEAGLRTAMIIADSGDLALRWGNYALFKKLAEQNISAFLKYEIKRIVCTSPHDYNILKKEYRLLFGMKNIEILHHTELLAELIDKGAIVPQKQIDKNVFWHDPCFLGRYNDIYDIPRRILKSIPGVILAEGERNRQRSLCCGGYNAALFEDKSDMTLKAFRAKEVQFAGANILCTACPFCKIMLAKGMTEINIRNINVSDIAEFLYGSIKKEV